MFYEDSGKEAMIDLREGSFEFLITLGKIWAVL